MQPGRSRRRRRTAVLACAVLVVAVTAVLFAQSPWVGGSRPRLADSVTVNAGLSGADFPAGSVGLAIPVRDIRSDALDPSKGNLVPLLKLLGHGVLRVGGSSADLTFWTSHNEPKPTWAPTLIGPADLRRLNALLQATGWRATLTVNLAHFDPARAADEVAAAHEILAERLLAVAVGNEPDLYPHNHVRATSYSVADYLREGAAYRSVLTRVVPGLAFIGPDTSYPDWLDAYAAGHAHDDLAIGEHFYPLAACGGAHPSPYHLFSPATLAFERTVLTKVLIAARQAGVPGRITETNVLACGASPAIGVSLTTATWAMDWALKAMRAGMIGVDFHGTVSGCRPQLGNPLCSLPATGSGSPRTLVAPEFYGLLAAVSMQGGHFQAAKVKGSRGVEAFATRMADGTLRVAVLALDLAAPARTITVQLPGTSTASIALLTADGKARANVTFGGARVGSDGSFRPVWAPLPGTGGRFTFQLAPGAVAVLSTAAAG